MSDRLQPNYFDATPPAIHAQQTLDDLLVELMALPQNPYVAGAIAVIKGFGLVKDFMFQDSVQADLQEIKSMLIEVNGKVDKILAIVSRIDEIVRGELADNEKLRLMIEITTVQTTSGNKIGKYLEGGQNAGEPFDPGDFENLVEEADKVSSMGLQLSKWGYDAHVGVALAYSIYLFITRSVGKSFQDPLLLKEDIYNAVVEARDGLIEERRKMLESNARVIAALNNNDAIERKFILQANVSTIYCETLSGNWNERRGYRMTEQRIFDYVAPPEYRFPGDISPIFNNIDMKMGYTIVSLQIKKIMTETATALQQQLWTQNDIDEIDALIASAKAVAEAILVA